MELVTLLPTEKGIRSEIEGARVRGNEEELYLVQLSAMSQK